MQYIVTGKEMKYLDEQTSVHFGVPSVVLMEQAAQAFVVRFLELSPDPESVLVVCGTGNNGGDGLAIARLLNQRGIAAYVYYPKDPSEGNPSELFLLQKKIYDAYGYPMVEHLDVSTSYSVIVDAIFGTGLTRELRDPYVTCIEQLNQMSGHKVAVDIASGVSADDGKICGSAFRAQDTITFSFAKVGLYLFPGAGYCGRIHVVPIGITGESFCGLTPLLSAVDSPDLEELPQRVSNSHKGTYGKLLVIAGSRNMAGAAVFAAEAAYRVGTGLVKVMTCAENASAILGHIPEAILSTYTDKIEEEKLILEISQADAIVIGPGIGTDPQAEVLLRLVITHSCVPMVLDADALNLMAKSRELLAGVHPNWIVTPHLGEMSRLTGESVGQIKTQLLETARTFAKDHKLTCVLKDARTVTVTPEGRSYLNLSGNSGMATAGSGDVLSGIIGGFLAQGASTEKAASLGVYLHGCAGDCARNRLGARSMIARDILGGISEVLKQ